MFEVMNFDANPVLKNTLYKSRLKVRKGNIMAVDSVGYVNFYDNAVKANQTSFGRRGVDPMNDSIYIDPKTGEFTTWKPGIHNPEQGKKNNYTKTALTVLALATTAVLGFVFRGKLKDLGGKVVDAVKNAKIGDYFKNLKDKLPKMDAVKDTLKGWKDSAVNFFKGLIPKKGATPTPTPTSAPAGTP